MNAAEKIHERDLAQRLSEAEATIEVPLTDHWSSPDAFANPAAGPAIASSATRLADGRLAVDLAFLATPHRLEVELDPSTATFFARWPLVPLFGGGLAPQLGSMHVPD